MLATGGDHAGDPRVNYEFFIPSGKFGTDIDWCEDSEGPVAVTEEGVIVS